MKHIFVPLFLAAVTAAVPAAAAETLRNPAGTAASTTSTLRNPPTSGTTQGQRPGVRPTAGLAGGGDTRPSKGSDAQSPPPAKDFDPGPVGTRGPGALNSDATTAVGSGTPSPLNPAGANGGTTPGGLGAASPNGGTAGSGSKAAPMRANGIRKIN